MVLLSVQRPRTYFLKFIDPHRSCYIKMKKKKTLKETFEVGCAKNVMIYGIVRKPQGTYRVVNIKQFHRFWVVHWEMQIRSKPFGCNQTVCRIRKFGKFFQELIFQPSCVQSIRWKQNIWDEYEWTRKTRLGYPNSSRMFWTSINPIEGGRPNFLALLISRQSSYE